MISPTLHIELRPSSELMLALDAIVTAGNRLAAAIEASNKSDRPVAAPVAAPAAVPIAKPQISETMMMDAMQIIRWAAQRGMSVLLPINDLDMSRINDKAKAIGHPPIVYAPSPRPGRAS